jgi:hypothetical protein
MILVVLVTSIEAGSSSWAANSKDVFRRDGHIYKGTGHAVEADECFASCSAWTVHIIHDNTSQAGGTAKHYSSNSCTTLHLMTHVSMCPFVNKCYFLAPATAGCSSFLFKCVTRIAL